MNTLPPNATPKQRMRRRATKDGYGFAIAFLIATNLISVYHYARLALADPRDYLAYNGTTGPFALPDGALPPQAPSPVGVSRSVFHAGETAYWTTNLCLEPGVSVTGHAQLVRNRQNDTPEEMIDHRDSPVSPEMHRCGPRLGSFRFPLDALPGAYQIRRSVTIDPPRDGGLAAFVRRIWPLEIQLDVLTTQVVTTINTTPASLAPAPAVDP